ncbi:MAG: YqhA family protein [Actinobacteria bacterium]|nr:YqhA family protein [Actinomycetota bacterium]
MADRPREEDGAAPTGSTRGESSRPAATAEAFTARRARPTPVDRFERALSLSRIVVILPVIVLLLAALSSFVYGTDVFIRSVARVVQDPHLTAHNLGFLLLLTDLFLVGATLMIAGFGFYDLFVTRIERDDPKLRLPAWLRMRDLEDLKARVVAMVILVLAVGFADDVVESGVPLDALYLGGGVALVIAALTLFLRLSR